MSEGEITRKAAEIMKVCRTGTLSAVDHVTISDQLEAARWRLVCHLAETDLSIEDAVKEYRGLQLQSGQYNTW